MNQEKSEKLLIIFFLLFWAIITLSLLNRSLWIDEAITHWLSKGSFKETVIKVFSFHSFSPLFFLFENLVIKVSNSEVALRMPSFIFGIASLCSIFLLAKLLFDKPTALLSILILISSSDFIATTVNARPYSLGMLAVILSVYFLLLWIESNKSIYLYAHSICSIVMILSHYLFSLMLPIFIFIFLARKEKNNSSLKLLTALSVSLIPLLIGFFQLQNINKTANMSFSTVSIFDVLRSIIHPCLFILVFVCIIKYFPKLNKLNAKLRTLETTKLRILIAWYLLPPMLLWVLGYISNSPLYQSRYVVYCLPAYALLSSYLLLNFFEKKARPLLIVMFQAVCIYLQFNSQTSSNENWRKAVNLIKEQKDYDKTKPVLVHSTLMESASNDWLLKKRNSEYLMAPLLYYNIANRKIPLPMLLSLEKHKKYYTKVLEPTIHTHNQIYIITRGGIRGVDYLNNFFNKVGFKVRVVFESKSVFLLMAER